MRLNSWSPSSLRSWPTCSDTAASVTPMSAAAALTDPSRTTVANARSWVGVMSEQNLTVDQYGGSALPRIASHTRDGVSGMSTCRTP